MVIRNGSAGQTCSILNDPAVIPLGSHDMFLADIVAIDVDEALIGSDGKLRLEKAGIVAYAHGDYFELGKRIGSFGFSVAKKKKKPQGKKK